MGLTFSAPTGQTISGNTISGNVLSDNGFDGIGLDHGSNNMISGNTVRSNQYRGIWLGSDTDSNLVYNNHLADNLQGNAYDAGVNDWNIDKTPGTNIVGGPYLGGNYYSDYIGVDLDQDGIGETPYMILGGTNVDFLPLVSYSAIPTLSEWGLIIMASLLLTVGVVVILRHRPSRLAGA
jgi:parallel beta-helix repeat protein